jgi:hypothetical protein
MSAAEIIEQIKTLPATEQQEVVNFMKAFSREPGGSRDAQSREERFQKAADKVFSEHSELLRRLAQ